MIFGRGAGGGSDHRVTKQAGWIRLHQLTVEGGLQNDKRAALDLNRGLGNHLAARLNGMYEKSELSRSLRARALLDSPPRLPSWPVSRRRLGWDTSTSAITGRRTAASRVIQRPAGGDRSLDPSVTRR